MQTDETDRNTIPEGDRAAETPRPIEDLPDPVVYRPKRRPRGLGDDATRHKEGGAGSRQDDE